ncbi:MAG: radical SAM protein [Anaeromicrobium sp.]|jgi:hypothetical protein|uniref:radical SAM protein n=1 Tax=Anaeromicrobium sp. TaxID=1929132 RepID=UPI0025CD3613|nr:radical SAM protein [Anaeromicrobium sp.]MCT4592696.1 radical SAM protein [Anaeromicrobium sp.]
MKWTNKGHQFDEIGKLFKNINRVYIYGAGMYGEKLYKNIKFINCIEAFVDGNIEKQESGYLGKKVISPEEFFKINPNGDHIVIVAASMGNTPVILKELLLSGYKECINCFAYNRFVEFYFPIFSLYRYDKLYFEEMTTSITQRCTLKCEKCSCLFPYVNDPKDYELQSLKEDMDCFFSKIDYLQRLSIIGGEPFLFSNLTEYVSYICENYLEKIGKIVIVSNGTIVPNKELAYVLKKNKIVVEISDYTKSLPFLNKKLEKLKSYLNQQGIEIIEIFHDQWVDFGFESVDNSDFTSKQLISLFKKCDIRCRGLKDKSLIMCMPSEHANVVLSKFKDDENYFDLLNECENIKKIILEYNMGYTNEGYLHMCKYCNGGVPINKHIIESAKQIKM